MTTATLPGWLPRRSAETAWPWPGSPGQPAGCQPGGGAATPPATATITTDVTFRGLTSGQTASVTVTATATGQVLASAMVTPATDGTATGR